MKYQCFVSHIQSNNLILCFQKKNFLFFLFETWFNFLFKSLIYDTLFIAKAKCEKDVDFLIFFKCFLFLNFSMIVCIFMIVLSKNFIFNSKKVQSKSSTANKRFRVIFFLFTSLSIQNSFVKSKHFIYSFNHLSTFKGDRVGS